MFVINQSYIWDRVSLWSGELLIAWVIKSAYDRLPQAFRLDAFVPQLPEEEVEKFDEDEWLRLVDNIDELLLLGWW